MELWSTEALSLWPGIAVAMLQQVQWQAERAVFPSWAKYVAHREGEGEMVGRKREGQRERERDTWRESEIMA